MALQDIITKLLQRDPKDRLGTVNGAEDIKAHPFFADIQWALIRHRTPPYVPANQAAQQRSTPRLTRSDPDLR